MAQPKKKENYVDPKLFYNAMVDFLENRKIDPECPIPEFVGECVYKICTKICFMPKFINYHYRDEMQSQGIENCVRYIDRFNPEKGTNAFAYFSSIAYYACIQTINKEKRQMETKARWVQTGGLYLDIVTSAEDAGEDFVDVESISTLEYLYNYIAPIKVKKPKKTTEFDLSEFGGN